MRFRLFAALLLLLGLALPAPALDVPPPDGYVTDRAGLLSRGTERKLEDFLRSFESSDSTQIVVLTTPSLEGEALDAYSLRVAETWGVGQKEHDNGALLLVAKDDRQMRIEVGYGLEGRLTDLLAGRIIDNEIAPRFGQGDFDGGITAGVVAMAQAVRGEYQGKDQTAERKRSPFGLLFLLFFLGPALLRLFAPRSHRRGGMWYGGGFGGRGGGGFGGGGFSGGGGGFGGGGASGRW